MGNKIPATARCEGMVVNITCLSHPSRGGGDKIPATARCKGKGGGGGGGCGFDSC